jgi:hypothetical protein
MDFIIFDENRISSGKKGSCASSKCLSNLSHFLAMVECLCDCSSFLSSNSSNFFVPFCGDIKQYPPLSIW